MINSEPALIYLPHGRLNRDYSPSLPPGLSSKFLCQLPTSTLTMPLKRSQTVQWPPVPSPDETEEERRVRLAAESEAKRVSDVIDRQLEVDRQRRKERRGPKILLLGMSRDHSGPHGQSCHPHSQSPYQAKQNQGSRLLSRIFNSISHRNRLKKR